MAICGALLAVVLFAVTAPRLGRHLPPALATRLLVPAMLVMAAATVFSLGLPAATLLVQLPPVAAMGPWSAIRLDAYNPVPDVLAAIGLVLLIAAAVHVLVKTVRRVRSLIAIYRTYHGVRSAGSVIVIDSDRVDAFATPAPAGRVVVTSALLRALSPAERRAVLAHERSHLAHRHVWWALTADLAAAVNPLLRPTATTIGHAIERWADEDAATVIGDRQLVARTIARSALLRHDAHTAADNTLLPAATGADVPQRVLALLAPPPRRRPLAFAALAVLLAAGILATFAVEQSGDHLFDHALLRPAHTAPYRPGQGD
jgi:beta-lactamase regulating signal transducer with metallopeptidase domain